MSSSLCFWWSWTKWDRWEDLRDHLFVCGVNQRNEGGRQVQDSLMLLQEWISFPSVVPRARWCNLVRVERLWMIKWMAVVSVLVVIDVTLGGSCGISENWQFQESAISPGLFQDFIFFSRFYSREWGRRAIQGFVVLFWCDPGELEGRRFRNTLA